MAVFNEKTGYTKSGRDAQAFQFPQRTLNTVLWAAFMFTVNIILLNLLIAIMATSYARVQKSAKRGPPPLPPATVVVAAANADAAMHTKNKGEGCTGPDRAPSA